MKWQTSPTGLWLIKDGLKFCIELTHPPRGAAGLQYYRIWFHRPDGYVHECPIRFDSQKKAKLYAEKTFLANDATDQDAHFVGGFLLAGTVLILILMVMGWMLHK